MNNSIRFSFVVHNHQPAGNFDSVFEDAYAQCYRPFIDVLSGFPRVKFTQHWTGTLLEWLAKHHPDFIDRLRLLVQRGQLELLTGSYYEAILPVIPSEDQVGQIRKLTGLLTDLFAVRPRGMWLAERVWEPQLVRPLAEAGVEYLLLDDTHFRMAGVDEERLSAYYRTEDLGSVLDVIPMDKDLRYLIPFHRVEETKHHLQRKAVAGRDAFLVHADDGEKFGVWPKTYDSVYGEKWLEEFCGMVEQEEWIETVHLSDMIDRIPPVGRVYLPSASYYEMMKWALPTDDAFHLEQFEKKLREDGGEEDRARFVRGSFWRNFLGKYPEANHMHKKMLRVAGRLREAERKGLNNLSQIRDHLWAGQCNDAYWHGVFGGLYLPNLRFPVYRNLLQAEELLDRLDGDPALRVERVDFDCDGHEEIMVEGERMNCYFKPSTGGHLVELDYKPCSINLLDILSRREEIYHRRLLAGGNGEADGGSLTVKEEGLEKNLHFDWYRHASLVDHFFGEETTVESFASARYLETGDFVSHPYEVKVEQNAESVAVGLSRVGAVWFGEKPHRLTLSKTITYRMGSDDIDVTYAIRNGEKSAVDLWFGVEFNVGLQAGDAPDRFYEIDGRRPEDPRLRSMGESGDVRSVRLVDRWLGIETELTLEQPATVWRCPIETVSLSEGGLERVYQSSMIVPHWRFRLAKTFSVRLRQSVRRLVREGTKKGSLT